jgi:pilus assembly protein TadC
LNIVPIMSMIVILFISFLGYRITRDLIKFRQMNKVKEAVWKKKLKDNKKGYFSYLRIEKYLVSNGSPLGLTPYTFLQWKIISGILFMLLLVKEVNLLAGIVGLIGGFFLLDIMIYASNKSDNEKIIGDLSGIYDSLKIQTKAGVFITSAIGECYLIAKNKRFKKALLELNADLVLKKDLDGAIDKFNSKFNCPHIDSFCATIKQSAESGKCSQALNDLASQIKEINMVLEYQKSNRMSRKITMLQIAILIGIIAILLYSVFIELGRNLMNF